MTITTTSKPQTLRAVLVVQTYVTDSRKNGRYFEVHCAEDPPAPVVAHHMRHDCSACTVLLTRDQDLYERFTPFDGTNTRVNAVWCYGTRPDGKRCQILLELVP